MEAKQILLVDDSSTSRMIMKRCFEMAGYRDITFHECEDGLKAVTFLRGHEVDLIVTDLNMPKMDGVTFVKKLHIDGTMEHTSVIVLSSLGNEAIEAELKKAGVKLILKKPFSPAKVLEIMEGENG